MIRDKQLPRVNGTTKCVRKVPNPGVALSVKAFALHRVEFETNYPYVIAKNLPVSLDSTTSANIGNHERFLVKGTAANKIFRHPW